MILQELSIQIPNKYIEFVEKLNSDQMIAFNTIMNVINHKERVVFCWWSQRYKKNLSLSGYNGRFEK